MPEAMMVDSESNQVAVARTVNPRAQAHNLIRDPQWELHRNCKAHKVNELKCSNSIQKLFSNGVV